MRLPARLEARGITYGYPRHDALIREWDAEFGVGTLTALTGPSGRGKSTLLYLLGLMLVPRSGEILVGGRPAHRLRDSELSRLRAEEFGFVFQDAALDPSRTVLDNVLETALYRGQSRIALIPRARGLLERFGVEVESDRKPGQVSGGQAQRIALCRALVSEPAIILADEPTGNLDSMTAELVFGELQAQARAGATVILVTHSPDLAERCDERILL